MSIQKLKDEITASLDTREVRPEQLKAAKYNPVGRVDPKNIRDLVASIEAVGQLYPILIDRHFNIIDGHRRHAAITELGMDTCLVRVIGGDPEQVYAEVNSAAKPLSGNDHLTVYCHAPQAVTGKSYTRLKKMQEVAGDDLMEFVANHGGSVATFELAVSLAKFCGVLSDLEMIRSMTKWLITTKSSFAVRKAMADDVSAAVILKCVKSGKTLRRSWSVN